MLIVTSVFTRPNTEIPFTPTVQSFIDYRESTYVQTGKLLSRVIEDSEDGLVRTLVSSWKTRDDFNEFRNDPVTKDFRAIRKAYLIENNISVKHTYKFVPTPEDPAD